MLNSILSYDMNCTSTVTVFNFYLVNALESFCSQPGTWVKLSLKFCPVFLFHICGAQD